MKKKVLDMLDKDADIERAMNMVRNIESLRNRKKACEGTLIEFARTLGRMTGVDENMVLDGLNTGDKTIEIPNAE